jgi:alpha-galactosidase
MKSPLIIGTSLDLLPATHVAILANRFLIAFSQDPIYGRPATPYKWGTNPDWTFDPEIPAEYWSGGSSQGTLVLMLNAGETNATRSARWDEIPQLGGSGYEVTDVWTGENLGCIANGLDILLESHDTAALLVGCECEIQGTKKKWKA